MRAKVNRVIIEVVSGDVLSVDVDAPVNATDSGLTIPDFLAKAAGEDLVKEALMIGWCDIGAAVMTGPGKLNARKVIHAVGPRWGEDSVRGKLANATWECLRLAEESELVSIALPAIATGADGGYPVEACARIMMKQIVDFTFEPLKFLRHIYLCPGTQSGIDAFNHEFQRQLQDLNDTGEGKVRVG